MNTSSRVYENRQIVTSLWWPRGGSVCIILYYTPRLMLTLTLPDTHHHMCEFISPSSHLNNHVLHFNSLKNPKICNVAPLPEPSCSPSSSYAAIILPSHWASVGNARITLPSLGIWGIFTLPAIAVCPSADRWGGCFSPSAGFDNTLEDTEGTGGAASKLDMLRGSRHSSVAVY